MKKIYLPILLFLMTLGVSYGQTDAMEKLEAAKIALITERLELTPDQAEKFWPIYRQFADEQKSLRREFQQLKQGYDPSQATEAQNQQMLDEGLKIREKQLNLEKTYSSRMQEVISTRQLMNLRKAEDDFKQMLLKRIKEQQQQRQDLQNQRLRNNENMRQRKN